MAGTPTFARRRTGLLASLLMITSLVVAACTGGAAKPADVSTVAALTCHDSAGQQGRDTGPARLVNGVEGFVGDAGGYDALTVWGKVDGHGYLSWKTALAVASNAKPYRTVSVVSPASARLAYGWPPSSPARAVRLPACGQRWTLYAGGILVRQGACVRLAVAGRTGKPITVRVAVQATRC